MRRPLPWMLVAACCVVTPSAARADDADIARRLDSLATAIERMDSSVQGLAARLDRIDRRLSEIEARLDKLEAPTAAPGGTPDAHPAPTPEAPDVTVTNVIVSNKRIDTRADTGDDYLRIDVEAVVKGLKKAARIKGRFQLLDRFDDVKKTYEVMTEVLRPGDRLILRGVAFRLTRSAQEDLWLRNVDIRELRGKFEITEVVYGVDVQDAPNR
jgi:hypothetical protein